MMEGPEKTCPIGGWKYKWRWYGGDTVGNWVYVRLSAAGNWVENWTFKTFAPSPHHGGNP